MHWFNHRRLLGPIGHVPPAEAEARFHSQLKNTTMAAQNAKRNRPRDTRGGSHRLRAALGMEGGQLVANPPPMEIPAAEMGPLIERATREAAGLRGKALTPWVLARLVELTGGWTLRVNAALVASNATLAARIARELCALPRRSP